MNDKLTNHLFEYLKNNLGENNFRDWFAKSYITYENGYFLILPNEFIHNWVMSNYRNIIKSFATSVGIEIDIKCRASSILETKINDDIESSNINVDFTFDNFLVAKCNQMAYEAAVRVAQSRDIIFNPLFIYGNVGLGKTHLMHSIANERKKSLSNQKIIYLSAEQFMNNFINALKTKTIMTFKEEFRAADLVLIDDFQFLGSKDATQEEFFHSFNTLLEHKKQLVISADQPPHTLPGIEARLKSRLGWGLVVDVHPATYELKISILKEKAKKLNIDMDDNIIGLICQKINSSIRELEGAFLRVTKYAEWMKQEITSDLVNEILHNTYDQRKRTSQEIISIICNQLNISIEILKSKDRKREVVRARQKFIYIYQKSTGSSYLHIARILGGKDHTSIMYAKNKAEELITTDQEFAESIKSLQATLNIA